MIGELGKPLNKAGKEIGWREPPKERGEEKEVWGKGCRRERSIKRRTSRSEGSREQKTAEGPSPGWEQI